MTVRIQNTDKVYLVYWAEHCHMGFPNHYLSMLLMRTPSSDI